MARRGYNGEPIASIKRGIAAWNDQVAVTTDSGDDAPGRPLNLADQVHIRRRLRLYARFDYVRARIRYQAYLFKVIELLRLTLNSDIIGADKIAAAQQPDQFPRLVCRTPARHYGYSA